MASAFFSPLSTDARRSLRAGYREFLAARDGAPDLERRTLARREESLRRFLASTPPEPRPDRALFDAQYREYDPRRDTSRELLLLLTFVKINAAEAYGVERVYDDAMARAKRGEDDLEILVILEERYHTQILGSAARLYGFETGAPYRPTRGLKALIGGIARAPQAMSRPLVLASEIAGVLTFLRLLRATRDVLRDDPATRDALEERLIEVMIDEVGHVTFNRICLGAVGLAQARAMLPLVAIGTADAIPEARTLGVLPVSHRDFADFTLDALPAEVRAKTFVA
jgi:hypothetical protein